MTLSLGRLCIVHRTLAQKIVPPRDWKGGEEGARAGGQKRVVEAGKAWRMGAGEEWAGKEGRGVGQERWLTTEKPGRVWRRCFSRRPS